MMLKELIEILNRYNELSGWKIIEKIHKEYELYYIYRELEMNRSKDIRTFDITIYKDFEDFKSSSVIKVQPSMTEDEITEAIDHAIYAAQFAKQPYYPLVEPNDVKLTNIESNLSTKPLQEFLPEIVNAIFKADVYEDGCINSTEIFLKNLKFHLVTSTGIDYSYENNTGEIEFITNWKETEEEIELYKHLNFAYFDADQLTKEVDEMLKMSKGRANAQNTPSLSQCNLLLSKESLIKVFDYYISQTNANTIYEKISDIKLEDSIQGENIIGDKITIELDPHLKTSSLSKPFDNDGIILNKINIIEDGVVKNIWGSQTYSYYLNLNPTGNIDNMVIHGGSQSISELKSDPYLEVVAFSDLQVDDFTGDFGGEIRFGWYYDGENRTPISGGSVSGNIKNVQKEMYLSKEIIELDHYIGPKYLKLKNITVAGND